MEEFLVRKYVRELLLTELKFNKELDREYGSFFSNLWDSLKNRIVSVFTAHEDGEESPPQARATTSFNIRDEIEEALDDVELYFGKRINPSARADIKKKSIDIYNQSLKKGASEKAAAKKAMQFLQIQISRSST